MAASLALAGGALIGIVGLLGQSPAAALTAPSCTFGGVAPSTTGPVLHVNATGDTSVMITCTHLPVKAATGTTPVKPETFVPAEASPLEQVLTSTNDGTGAAESMLVNTLVLVKGTLTSTDTYEHLTYTFTVVSGHDSKNATAACPPTQAQVDTGFTNCAVALANLTGTNFGDVLLNFGAAQLAPQTPTVTVTPSTAAAGDHVTLSGSGFWGVEVYPTPDSTLGIPAPTVLVDGTAVSTATASISAPTYKENSTYTGGTLTPGVLTGSVTLPGTLTKGATADVTVVQANTAQDTNSPYNSSTTAGSPSPQAVEGTGTVAIDPAPSLTAVPTTGSAPSSVALTGTDFDPQGGTVSCTFTTASSGGSVSTSTLVLNTTTGTATGHITVTTGDALGSNPITCKQTSHSGTTLRATASFTVTTLPAQCSIGPAGTAGGVTTATCLVKQVIESTVSGTDLTIFDVVNSTPNATGVANPTRSNVTLSGVTLGDHNPNTAHCPAATTPGPCNTQKEAASTGHLNTIQVSDNRGDLVGWTVTGQMEGTFSEATTSGDNTTIPASNLIWEPSVHTTTPSSCVTLDGVSVCDASDVLTEITAGPAATLSKSAADMLCSAASGGGGGGTNCTATLTLAVPPYVAQGRYAAVMNIVVS